MRKIIFASLLLLLLAMACVSASDADDIAIQTSDNASDVIASDEVNIETTEVSDDNLLYDSSFDDLQSYIDDTPEGGEIELHNDYSIADGGNTLKITKNITINGNNHILNGAGENAIIAITVDGKNVFLKNIKFTKGASPKHGGAIYNGHDSSSLVIDNCTFDNNNADNYGGAIYSEGKLDIYNSKFNYNKADSEGGAIYSEGKLDIYNSKFNYNKADGKGGAITAYGELNIDSCIFDHNNLDSGEGGAIYSDGKLDIFNSKFESNFVDAYKSDGGAIYCNGETHINRSDFNDNYAGHKPKSGVDITVGRGGAIYANDKCYIESSNFTKNFASMLASAIVANGNLIINGKSEFSIHSYSGTIVAKSDLYINWNTEENDSLCYIYNNQNALGDGAGIYCYGKLYGKFLKFQDNWAAKANDGGGAIHCQKEVHISNSEFISNKASIERAAFIQEVHPIRGGAIYSKGNCNIDSCIFDTNYADNGGAIFSEMNIKITGQNIFKYNYNIDSAFAFKPCGGAIYSSKNLYIENTIFTHNHVNGGGGAIYSLGEATIINSEFESNNAISGIWLDFLLPRNGGAIQIKGPLTIDNCTFNNNIAEADGGAIWADDEIKVTNSIFYNNTVSGDFESTMTGQRNGGAIYINSKCNPEFISCSFEKNEAFFGGAIYVDSSSTHLKLSDCTFKNNKVLVDGGAIFCKGEITISDSEFDSNHAKHASFDMSSYGGAIRGKKLITIKTSSFNKNIAENYGGAIYGDNEIIIKDSSFTNNQAKVDGGAVYCDGKTTISNSKFKDNKATGETAKRSFGGAVRSNGLTIIKNSAFKNNKAHNQGGALYVDAEISITSSNFTGNSAKLGGAFYAKTITETVSKSNFVNNDASSGDGGAIYINNKCSPEFTYCNFDNNTCTCDGGAIYLSSSSSPIKVSYSTFTGNRAYVDGGAIFCHEKTTISNSVFSSNIATGESASRSFGGAIRSEGLATLTDSEFYYNRADNQGGAIYADEEIRITRCIFDGNEAKSLAGAVYASTIKKTVTHSIFLYNKVKNGDGGAIYINNKCDPEFISCRFENNHATERGGAIFLDSHSALLKMTYCTFVDNRANDEGQIVYNKGDYNIIDKCWFGENEPYLTDLFNDYYPRTPLEIYMKIDSDDLYVGNTYELTVYFDKKINWLPSIHLTDDILHSTGKFYGDGNFSNVDADYMNNMTANVVFTKANPTIYFKLDNQIISLSPKVKDKVGSDVRILSYGDVKYPNAVKIDYQISNMTDATYIITNSEGEKICNGTITNPKSTLTFDLGLGNYSITILNKETFNTRSSNATANFSVYKLLNANITADNVTFGEYTTVTLNADTDGLYNVSFGIVGEGDRDTFEFEVVDGSCTRQIKLSPAGDYETHIRAGDYVVVNCTEALFTIYKANPNFKINVSKTDFYYGEDVLVNSYVVHPARGLVVYYINDEFYDISAAGITLELKNLNAGSYSVKAIYSGDINYLNDSDTLSFTVNRPQNNVVISVDNKTYGEKTYIEIHADVDGTYHVDVNGTVYDFNVCNGIGTDTFYFNAGVYYANVTFDNDNYNTTIQNTTFQIYKANVDLMIVVFDEIYPDEAECIIYASRDGEYNLTIEDYSTIVTVKDNIAYFEHSFPVGTYLAAVSFEGDNNYNKTYAVTTFTVYPEGTIFELEVHPNVITYGETATVTHTLSDGATGTIKYYLRNGTFLGELDVSENLTLPVLDIGYYVIIGNYSGANGFIPVTDSTLLTVKQAQNNVVVSVSNVTYGEDTLIEISANADGIYQLDLNGTIYNITVSNGVGNKSIALNTGKYYANISFYNKNYNTTIKNAVFEVYKADTHISIVALNITYPQELKGIIHSDVDGDYNLTVGTYSTIIPVENGQGEFNLGILDTGSYLIVANYSGDSNHNPAGYSLTITVNPALNNVIVTADNVTYGKDTKIEISADTDGIYQLDLNGTIYNITVVNGTGNKSIALDAGKYYANVTFNNKNYNTTIKNATFEVYKAATDIFVVGYHTIYPQEIEGIVYSNVDGEYNLTIGDYSTVIVVEHGRAKFNAGVFDAGNYTVTVTYKGDRNHMSNSSSDNFTVDAFHPDVTLSVSDIDYGGVAIIRITCDVAGYVNVTVNGITETLELNGQTRDLLFATADNVLRSEYTATLRLYNLDPGSYPVTVVYNGDRNFDNTTATEEFKVNHLNSTIDIKTKDINVGDDETITVKLISNATGTVTVSIDGKNYTAAVKDGKAIITIPNLSAGDKTADVYYSGDKYYNPNMTTASFTVKKLKPNMSIDSNEPYSGEKIHIVVKLPADATGTVTITLEGKNYTAPVKDGKAIFDIPGLPAGKYNIKVYYSGDDKYEATEMDSIIIVKEQKVNPINNTPTIVAAGNPILLLVLVLMTIATTTIRRFKK